LGAHQPQISNKMTNYLNKVRLDELTVHPVSYEIYSPSCVEDLAKSIKNDGLLQAIIVNSENQVLVGRRRLEAIKSLGWEEVEVIVKDIPEEDVDGYIVSSNDVREKTPEEKYREILILTKRYGKKRGQRTDLDPEVNDDDKTSTRAKIAGILKTKETEIQRLKVIGDTAPHLLKIIGDDKKAGEISLNQAYNVCMADKSNRQTPVKEVELKPKCCSLCGRMPPRLVTTENGTLAFHQLEEDNQNFIKEAS
jgi:hypothetical protein